MIQAQKFTFQYDRAEDRLKMLINYDSVEARVDFFVTRAMLFKLIPAIEQLLIKAQTQTPEANLHVNTKATRLATKQKTDTSTMQLLENQRIFLLEKVDFQYNTKNSSIAMMLYAKSEQQCVAQFTSENFSQVMNAMIGAVPHTSWGMASNILEI